MTSTRNGPAELAAAVSGAARDLLGRIRRFGITRTTSAIWQVVGHVLLDKTRETRDAEVFPGVGFYARPPASGTPEAIVVFPGGAGNPIIAATRDETTRRAVFNLAGELAPGETAVFNASAVVILKADGSIEIRSAGGVALPVPTLAYFNAMRATYAAHTHLDPATGSTGVPSNVIAAPVGTTKAKLE